MRLETVNAGSNADGEGLFLKNESFISGAHRNANDARTTRVTRATLDKIDSLDLYATFKRKTHHFPSSET